MMTTVDESELRSFLHEHTPKWITEQEASLRVIAFPLTSELHERLAPFFGDTLADARISSVPMSSPAWYSDFVGRGVNHRGRLDFCNLVVSTFITAMNVVPNILSRTIIRLL